MYHSKIMSNQINESGIRIGDVIQVTPFYGHKKLLTLKSFKLDVVSSNYRPNDISFQFLELTSPQGGVFHYRIETEQRWQKEPRFVLRTIKGKPFLINGVVAKEAYVERSDRVVLDESKLTFMSENRSELTMDAFENPILHDSILMKSQLKILIQGETGSGKSHLAQKIHEKSGAQGKFVAVNLSSYNANLIESELFGHKKGSFTGAIHDKLGAFSLAQYGTLFLDEIDSLSLEIQTKLLTFLDSHSFRRVGDTQEETIHSRLIFASGRNLEDLVAQGLFRKDLYFRLKSGYSLTLKNLREDTPQIEKACMHFSLKHQISLTPRLLEFYLSCPWPGNIRQLLGHLEKKRILSKTTKIDFDIFDEELITQSSDLVLISEQDKIVSLKEMKQLYSKKVIGACDGNLILAAKMLRIPVRTLKQTLSH